MLRVKCPYELSVCARLFSHKLLRENALWLFVFAHWYDEDVVKSSSRGNAALTSAHTRVLFRTANPYKSVTQLFNSLKCGFVGEFQHNLEPEPPVISCNYVAGSATRDNEHKVIKRKAALSKNINRFYAEFEPLMVTMTGRQMSTFVTLWIIQRA